MDSEHRANQFAPQTFATESHDSLACNTVSDASIASVDVAAQVVKASTRTVADPGAIWCIGLTLIPMYQPSRQPPLALLESFCLTHGVRERRRHPLTAARAATT
jgi:hypothetical protein